MGQVSCNRLQVLRTLAKNDGKNRDLWQQYLSDSLIYLTFLDSFGAIGMADDQPITTSIDSLVKYLEEHGETDTSTLVKVLSVNEGTVVDWADILEKAGMVKITYRVGKMFLSPTVQPSGRQQAEVAKTITDVKKASVRTEIEIQQTLLNEIRSKLAMYAKTVSDADTVFREEGKTARPTLEKIGNLESEVNRLYNSLNAKKEGVNKLVEDLQKELTEMDKQTEQIKGYTFDSGNVKQMLEDVSKRVSAFNANIDDLNKAFEKIVDEHRRSIREMQASTISEINALREAVASENRKVADYERLTANFKRKADSTHKKLSMTRSSLLDEANRARDETLRLYNGAMSQMKSINQSIKSMKDSWGSLSAFNDKLTEVSKEVTDLAAQVDTANKSLSVMFQELSKLDQKGKGTQKEEEERSKKTMDIGEKAKKHRGITNSIVKKEGELKKKLGGLGKDDLSKKG